MITVKCFTDLSDLELDLESGATNAALIDQIRHRWPTTAGKRVRLVLGGKELDPRASLPPQPCVVHCVITDVVQSQTPQQQQQHQQHVIVKFVDGSRDLLVDLPDGALVSALFQKIREQRSFPEAQRLRIVCNGEELHSHALLPHQRPCIVHCTETSAPVPGHVPSPPDWVDLVGARTLLKLLVGGTLLIANHQVSVSGNASILLILLLTIFNVIFVLACFPQLRGLF